eukprot:TRINITY_DN92216_c0_g1_i1.p1 TRINITY_DN92216_c0_g1~~TRINITY_DN92216_c0_g1_i1.p1  ORF type:complete len:1003 (-),score=200.92 TRINITY_DN92216_c0_g1_i1:62-2881(-)
MSVSRGGLFDDEGLVQGGIGSPASTLLPASKDVLTGQSWRASSRGQTGSQASPAPLSEPIASWKDLGDPWEPEDVRRAETPLLAFVDRASFPGFYDPEEEDSKFRRSPQFRELQLAAPKSASSSRSAAPAAVPAGSAAGGVAGGAAASKISDDEWEAELMAWKRKYGCPDVQEPEMPVASAQALAASVPGGHVSSSKDLPGGYGSHDRSTAEKTLPEKTSQIHSTAEMALPERNVQTQTAASQEGQRAETTPDPRDLREDQAQVVMTAEDVEGRQTATDVDAKSEKGKTHSAEIESARTKTSAAVVDVSVGMLVEDTKHEVRGIVHQRTTTDVLIKKNDGQLHWSEIEDLQEIQDLEVTASPQEQPKPAQKTQSSVPEEHFPLPEGSEALGAEAAIPVIPMAGNIVPMAPPGQPPEDRPSSRRTGRAHSGGAVTAAEGAVSPKSKSAGRKDVYSQEELDSAMTSARNKAGSKSGWASEFAEGGLHVRDFLQDLRKNRDREKGRQATGPLWLHLAAQAKNMADRLDLDQLLESLKMFCSVRYDDYELYMRLLGEVPHYIKQASAQQLCQLIRLLARRRLRERNYVDMVAAHLLEKIRVTEDLLTARLLIKTANALAALECRSQPKFVEHFNRHLEHRIHELDATVCCIASPLFVANYMSDALRRSFLKRCAETSAGFQGPDYELRNLACIELILRKELHSFFASLPPFVTRYFEKVRSHAEFDKFGSIALPTTAVPDGPKGEERQELHLSLLRKASTATGGRSGDVFSSDMHRDVSACLTHLGTDHENGGVTGPYLLDVVAKDMVNPTRRIIYEVNAPHHYYEGTETLIAEKRLRHRLLQRCLGHKLIMINAPDWTPLTAAARMTFLLKLQQAEQDKHSEEYKKEAAANTARASKLPAIRYDAAKQPEPFKLKSVKDLSAPISVPVPPSKRRNRTPMSAR